MSKKLPSIQFYTGDWLKDPALRCCSLAARGLWLDLLCLMHESPRRGYLQHANGTPWSLEQIARSTGCSTDEASRLLRELEDSGVYSCTEHGSIYSRRLVRDDQKRQKCADAGKRGGGNPKLRADDSTYKGHPKRPPKGDGKGEANPSSSFSTSKESSDSNPLPPSGSGGSSRGDDIDWLVVESNFAIRWRSLQGTSGLTRAEIPTDLTRHFRERWLNQHWREQAELALKKFPLACGITISLAKFLKEESTVFNIVTGTYDWTKGEKNGNRNPSRVAAASGEYDG